MRITKIHPLVWVFHELVENPQEVIDFYEGNNKWEDWWTRGKYSMISNIEPRQYENFPTEELWNKNLFEKGANTEEEIIRKKITDAVHKASELYFKENYPDIKNLYFLSFDIAKYYSGGDMTYHTDYIQERFFMPGFKFHTTVLFYPNDNYEGGEISFLEVDDEKNILWYKDYKPQAGDIVVFSSRSPIYHGVLENKNGEKYIIRTYWRTNDEPTEEWTKGIEEHGEENWNKLQEERVKAMHAYQIHISLDSRNFTITTIPDKEIEKNDN